MVLLLCEVCYMLLFCITCWSLNSILYSMLLFAVLIIHWNLLTQIKLCRNQSISKHDTPYRTVPWVSWIISTLLHAGFCSPSLVWETFRTGCTQFVIWRAKINEPTIWRTMLVTYHCLRDALHWRGSPVGTLSPSVCPHPPSHHLCYTNKDAHVWKFESVF